MQGDSKSAAIVERDAALFDAMPDGVVVVDDSAVIHLWNASMTRMTARRPEDAIGASVFDDGVLQGASRTLREDIGRVFTGRTSSPAGSEAVAFLPGAGACRVCAAPYARWRETPAPQGGVPEFCLLRFQMLEERPGKGQDGETPHELRERCLRDSELGVMLIRTPDQDIQSAAILYANTAFRDISGYDPKMVIGRHPDVILSGAAGCDDAEALRRCVGRGEDRSTELPLSRGDGGRSWIKARLNPIFDSRGAVRHVVAFLRDITARKQSEIALEDALNRLQGANAALDRKQKFIKTILNNVDALVMVLDANGDVARVNRVFSDFVGVPEKDLAGAPGRRHLPPPVARLLPNISPDQEPAQTEAEMVSARGGQRWIDWRVVASDGFGDGREYLICTGTDVTERRRAELLGAGERKILEQLARDADLQAVADDLCRLVETLMPGSLASFLLLDEDKRRLRLLAAPSLPADYNEAIDGVEVGPAAGSCGAAAHTGQPVFTTDIASDPNWRPFADLAHRANVRSCWSTPVLDSGGAVLGTFALYHREPRAITMEERAILGKLTALAALAALAIEQMKARERIRYLALYDPLTDLPNRTLLLDRLSLSLAGARRRDATLALLFLDLDGFKDVNDAYGHCAGDEVLAEVGRRLCDAIRKSDTAARLGGDEFVVILMDVQDRAVVDMLAEKIIHALCAPIALKDTADHPEVSVGVSIGVSLFPDHAEDRDSLLTAADNAMYEAKTAGKGQWRFAKPPAG